jgi:hypothetical protein
MTPLTMRTSVAVLAAAGLTAFACGSQLPPAAPSTQSPPTVPAPAPQGNLTGTWSGSGSDSFSAEQVTWVLTQSDSAITGRAELSPVDPADGSCASCHKLRKGIVNGTFDGSTLTIRMSFPSGGEVPTPICTTDLSGTGTVIANQVTGTYSGTDSCEGFYSNGQMTLTRQP